MHFHTSLWNQIYPSSNDLLFVSISIKEGEQCYSSCNTGSGVLCLKHICIGAEAPEHMLVHNRYFVKNVTVVEKNPHPIVRSSRLRGRGRMTKRTPKSWKIASYLFCKSDTAKDKSLNLNEPNQKVHFGWKSVAFSSLLSLPLTHH